jgi:molybdopterin-guanine dinucleotide biosynthesis protein A
MSQNSQPRFGAAILASGGADKLAHGLGVPHKALIQLEGRALIDYVIAALKGCPELDRIVIVAHDDGAGPHLHTDVEVVRPQGGGFIEAIEAAGKALDDCDYLLLCTCDVPMLTPDAVSHFVQACRNRPGADFAYSVVKAPVVRAAFPASRRTVVNLVEGGFTSGCLGAMTGHFLDDNMDRIREFFGARKSKIALARLLGWRFLGKLLVRRLSLVGVIRRAEELLGCEVLPVISPHASVAFDIDKMSDLQIARQWAASR